MSDVRVLTTISDFDGSCHQRIFWPGKIFNDKYGNIFDYYTSENEYTKRKERLKPEHIALFDPYIVHNYDHYSVMRLKRFCTTCHVQMMKMIKRRFPQIVQIWDCEDDVFAIEPSNRLAYNYYNDHIKQNIDTACDIAQRVVVCNENQRCAFVERGVDEDKIVKVPNVLFRDAYPVRRWRAKKEGEPYKFVWYGSASYAGEVVDLILPAMGALKKAFPDAEFYLPEVFFLHIPEVRQKVLELGICIFPWIEPQDLGQWLHDENFDFGLHLAHDNTFNRARCSSKPKELLFSGATLPIQFERKIDRSGYVSEIRNPTHDEMIDYVKAMMDQDAYKKELRKLRKRWYGKLWFEDHEEAYEKLFLIDVLKQQGIITPKYMMADFAAG